MSTLLHVNSSPLYGRSVSRQLTSAFVSQWTTSHPDGKVVDRDLNATQIPPIDAGWVGAVYTPQEARTPQQQELLSLSDSLLAELEQADEYVFGVPMHNFGVPSVLKLWVDQISRVGKTFSYAGRKAEGPPHREEGDLHRRNWRYLRRSDADGLIQFCRAVFAVTLRLPWRYGRHISDGGWNHGPQPWARP